MNFDSSATFSDDTPTSSGLAVGKTCTIGKHDNTASATCFACDLSAVLIEVDAIAREIVLVLLHQAVQVVRHDTTVTQKLGGDLVPCFDTFGGFGNLPQIARLSHGVVVAQISLAFTGVLLQDFEQPGEARSDTDPRCTRNREARC